MKQYRIGVIGTENFHANQFTAFFNQKNENGEYRYPDCHVTLVWGHYPEASEKLVNELGADKVASGIEEMVENVDAVMITARDGKFHYEFAKPFIEAGIPAFIDKPFTIDPEQTLDLIRLAKEKGVPLCGGSSLKYADGIMEFKKFAESDKKSIVTGNLAAPLDFNSIYSGFFFYSSHLTEMTLEVFGYNPRKVMAMEKNGGVCVTVGYDDYLVTNNFNTGVGIYTGSIFALDGKSRYAEISLEKCAERETDDFVEMLRTGKMPYSYEKLAMPVFYMNAVHEAYESGKCVDIKFDAEREII